MKTLFIGLIIQLLKRLTSKEAVEYVTARVLFYADLSVSGEDKKAKVIADAKEFYKQSVFELSGLTGSWLNLLIEAAVAQLKAQQGA